MQRFLMYSRNKIFVSLTFILIIAVLVTIRECEYPLLTHSKLIEMCFVSKYSEKLFYNLSLSYIAAYIFYVIQIYIPQTTANRNAYRILEDKFQKEFRITSEFFFLIEQIAHISANSTIRYEESINPFYFKEFDGNNCILKRFSEIQTLETLVANIQEEFISTENSRYYNELDPYLVEFHTLFPIAAIQNCLECILYSFQSEKTFQVVSDDIISPIKQFLGQMKKIMPKCTKTMLTQCSDNLLINKYEKAYDSSGLSEYKFALLLKGPYSC